MFKVGDKVFLNKKHTSSRVWYTDEVFTIVKINENIATVDINFKNYNNCICVYYLEHYPIKKIRKEKLEKLCIK